MPELPEVETVRQTLRNLVIGKEISNVYVYHNNIIESDLDEFVSSLEGQVINEVNRIGKYLIFELDDFELISHLRMEGKYFLVNEFVKNKHDHVIFEFKDMSFLKYHDTRKFGKMSLVKKGTAMNSKQISKLGYEPFDQRLNAKDLFKRFKRTTRPIKTTLLDQTVIAGLGNIYVDEVLFMSKLHPTTPTNKIKKKQIEEIINNSIIVLEKAIALGGTTIHSYESSEGVTGLFQNKLLVHTKEGQPCPVCATTIEKMKVGGRGTYYCHKCQK
jgi:formamidopyrimidine-DNA glycosylase